MERMILIKYAELTTKKDNRRTFIDCLEKNIHKQLAGISYTLRAKNDRMYIETSMIEECLAKLQHVFGIHSLVCAYKVQSDFEVLKKEALSLLKNCSFHTFKVETRRSDKKFPIPSMEVSREVGAVLLRNLPHTSVDVHHPDLILHIEIREEYSYLSFEEFPGLGGYPVGVQGKGLLMLSGGIDSPVAGYLAMKRGIKVDCLYFESPPHTSIEAKNKVIALARKLTEYGGTIYLHVVPFTSLQEEIYKHVDSTYMITILRRMMYRIASNYAKKVKAQVLINGESVGQVASQTLKSMSVINEVTSMPVLRPVCCMDKLEIIELAKKIGTFETSILPYEDCCTIFVPKHPVIHPHLHRCIEFEKSFCYEELLQDTIDHIETIVIEKKESRYDDLL